MNNENPVLKDLEVVPNEYNDRDYEVKVSIPEFNCICPRTGLPDFANMEINYTPKDHIVELKSLKLYIVKFRNMGIFHEHVTNKIFDDFKGACNPKKIEVIGHFHARGGINTSVRAYWEE